MEPASGEWDERRWGPPPPAAERRRPERPPRLEAAAALIVGVEIAGVLLHSASGWLVGATSIAIVVGCARGLLAGRRWARWCTGLACLLQIVATGVVMVALARGLGGHVPVGFRVELGLRSIASLFVLHVLAAPPVGRWFEARWLERLG